VKYSQDSGSILLIYFPGIKHPDLKFKWIDPAQKRNFFDQFAKSNKYDPLNVENWYSITIAEIRRAV
jgi:hypothetical protein